MTDDLPSLETMRAQIRATPLPADARPLRRRPRLGRLALASGGALALAVAVVVVLIVTAGPSAPPAYAASVHTIAGRRTVTLTLREERDIPKLNALLAAEHTRIRVVPVVRGCDAPVHSVSNGRVIPGPAKTLLSSPTYQGGKLVRVEGLGIAVDTIAGRTFVVPAGKDAYLFGGRVVVGPAPSCVGIGPRINLRPVR